eukprot:evm.model.scf_443EXC.1 EVM.evm.TU.scf_443EXC.1   scf_443EXC:8454-9995(+)
MAWKRRGREGGRGGRKKGEGEAPVGRTDSAARIVLDGMAKLLGSSSFSRSRSSRESGRAGEEASRVGRQLSKKRFRWCFGPPEGRALGFERHPLAIEDRRSLAKQSSSCSTQPSDRGLEECHTSTEEVTSKYSDLFSDASDGQLDLEALEPSEANFALLLAECNRLKNEKRRMQQMMLEYDGQMEALASECQAIVAATNRRFVGAARKVKYMDKVVLSLREELDKKVRSNTNLELERKVLQHELSEAVSELETAAIQEAVLAAGV